MNLPSLPRGDADSSGPMADLFRVLASVRPGADTRLIKNAYEAAVSWHQKSRSPHVAHSVAVATILAEAGADDLILCAALLHDVFDCTPCTPAALRGEFGAEMADLVMGVLALDAPAAVMPGDERVLVIKLADRLQNMRTLRHMPPPTQVRKSRQTLEVLVPLARTIGMDVFTSELENRASAALQHHGQRLRTASGYVLAATAALLPASARTRWREEWLGELHVLATRRERITFAVQIMLGIGRLAVTLYQPAAGLKRAFSAVLAAAVTASGLIMAGWRAAAGVATIVLAALATLMWILHSDDRTSRFARLISAFRNTPPRAP
jgi:HD domain